MSFLLHPNYDPKYVALLSDRLEMEKQRSKQALEDMNCLRQKEVQNDSSQGWQDVKHISPNADLKI